MSDQRVNNPYSTPAPGTTPGTTPGATAPAGPLSPTALGVKPDARLAQAFLTQAFIWMFVGLLLSAGVAFVVQSNENLTAWAAQNYFLLAIGGFALAIAISWGINRISATVALGLFFIYAASLGLILGVIVASFNVQGQQASVVTAFLSASAIFGAAAIYGSVTKRSLASLGGILTMGLVGLVVAIVINWFVGSAAISWVISLIGVVLFTALTAYDVQRIQNGELAIATGSMEKGAVIGALHLYLDFINLFLFLLRLFGGGRD